MLLKQAIENVSNTSPETVQILDTDQNISVILHNFYSTKELVSGSKESP